MRLAAGEAEKGLRIFTVSFWGSSVCPISLATDTVEATRAGSLSHGIDAFQHTHRALSVHTREVLYCGACSPTVRVDLFVDSRGKICVLLSRAEVFSASGGEFAGYAVWMGLKRKLGYPDNRSGL
nr:hypothetical protein Iba_chr13dCG3890 [Ipomoea batatas]